MSPVLSDAQKEAILSNAIGLTVWGGERFRYLNRECVADALARALQKYANSGKLDVLTWVSEAEGRAMCDEMLVEVASRKLADHLLSTALQRAEARRVSGLIGLRMEQHL